MDIENTSNDEKKVYEVGYHLLPNIGEEGVSREVEKIKEIISKEDGEIVSEANPTLKDLAYEIEKQTKSYFGWIKFSASPDSVVKVKGKIDAMKSVLRYILVETVKESTLMADKEKRPSTRPEPAKEKDKEEPLEIDKAIEDAVIS